MNGMPAPEPLPRTRRIFLMPKGAWSAVGTALVVSIAFRLWGLVLGMLLGLAIHVARGLGVLLWVVPRELSQVACAATEQEESDVIAAHLAAIARPHAGCLRTAERRVQRGNSDPNIKERALEHLRAAQHMLAAERAAERVTTATSLRMLIKPTTVGLAVAGLVLLLFDERTSGPVLDDPWRMWGALITAAVTSSALTVRNRPGIRS